MYQKNNLVLRQKEQHMYVMYTIRRSMERFRKKKKEIYSIFCYRKSLRYKYLIR